MSDMKTAHVLPKFNYTHFLAFEVNVNGKIWLPWFTESWTITLWISLIYAITIFGIQRIMRSRQRFEIRGPLLAWNVVLAIFSLAGTIRIVPELLHMWYHTGWESTFCDMANYYEPPTFVWTLLFSLSKIYELGDTLFIVLRKQPLIFLHWYHHITVLVYVWYCAAYPTAPGRWFIAMNYSVHAMMYTYYALKVIRVKLPKWIAMVLTALQISQMVVGLIVNTQAYSVLSRGDPCHQSSQNMQLCLAMYASYLLLFLNYFYQAYMAHKPRRASGKVPDNNNVHHTNAELKQNGVYTNGTIEHYNGVISNDQKVKSQ